MAKTTQPSKKPLLFPFQLIRHDLNRVEERLRAQILDFDPGVLPYMEYICNTAGKRIRPSLTLLMAGALGKQSDDHINLSTILELIHMATLVHDDIIDGASSRRNLPTANCKWGNGMAVLLGDALFSHSLAMATEFNDLHLSRRIAQASREVCQGEILQTQRRFDLTMTQADYYKMIGMKTGALFAAATELSAYLSGADEAQCKAFHQLGMELGTAYQIYDDCLDLVGSEEESGKTLRTDLEKGKLTLPILYLLDNADIPQREKLQKRIINQEPLDLHILLGIADYAGAIEYAVEQGNCRITLARNILQTLPDTKYRKALQGIFDYLGTLLEGCLPR